MHPSTHGRVKRLLGATSDGLTRTDLGSGLGLSESVLDEVVADQTFCMVGDRIRLASVPDADVGAMRQELDRLREENPRLVAENLSLKARLRRIATTAAMAESGEA